MYRGTDKDIMPTESNSATMLDFFRHRYDPTDDDIRRVFPSYEPWDKDQWLDYYETSGTNFDDHVRFTLQKLRGVTTSYALTDVQTRQLQALMMSGTFEDYCNVMMPRQMAYVGC